MVDPVVVSEAPGTADQSIFQVNWAVYRKMIDNNYLFHSNVYGRLREVLEMEVARPYSFLDVACGDGSATILALRGTRVSRYFGIDQSRPALEAANQVLSQLPCRVSLTEGDFLTRMRDWRETVDIVWIGLSLHHLHRPAKLEMMAAVRRALAKQGRFLIYENTSPDGESREDWLARWLLQKPAWTAYDDVDWDAMWAHVSNCDFPETDASWRALGVEAGFGGVRELFRAPTDLFRMYEFWGE